MIIFILMLVFFNTIIPQNIYDIPFNSKNNRVELEILNLTDEVVTNMTVKSINISGNIIFATSNTNIINLGPFNRKKMNFSFRHNESSSKYGLDTIKFEIISNNSKIYKNVIVNLLPPANFKLEQNYPNPFNPTTTLNYNVPGNLSEDTYNVKLIVYDILGCKMETIVDERQPPGSYQYIWDASNYPSGMYICRLKAISDLDEDYFASVKMLLLK